MLRILLERQICIKLEFIPTTQNFQCPILCSDNIHSCQTVFWCYYIFQYQKSSHYFTNHLIPLRKDQIYRFSHQWEEEMQYERVLFKCEVFSACGCM